MSNEKDLLFSLTKRDFDMEFFRAGGKGGQKQNKTSSGVRIRHRASGAVGECRNHRSQHQNKEEAFRRLVSSIEFKLWHAKEVSRQLGNGTAEEKVAESMSPENVLLEVKDEKGRWKAVR